MSATRTVPEWITSPRPVPYPEAVADMERHVDAMLRGGARERVWLLEHPPVYTVGSRGKVEDAPRRGSFPVYRTGRGGQVTYHGPGQRIAYVMLDLRTRGRDIRRFVRGLETWVILALADLGVTAERWEGNVGVWTRNSRERRAKIAAIGVRFRRGVTFHGVSINVDPDLRHYEGFAPCGVVDAGVTSLRTLGREVAMDDVDRSLKARFGTAFPEPEREPSGTETHPHRE